MEDKSFGIHTQELYFFILCICILTSFHIEKPKYMVSR